MTLENGEGGDGFSTVREHHSVIEKSVFHKDQIGLSESVKNFIIL